MKSNTLLLKFVFVLLTIFCFNTSASAQKDTSDYLIYDVIYLKKGGTLWGEITSFDEVTGGIVFKDQYGKTYSLGRDDYDYFIQDKVVVNRKKKRAEKVIYPRKDGELAFYAGVTTEYANYNNNLTPDDYYLNSFGATNTSIPIAFKFGAGKYLSRQHFVGLTAEVPLISDMKYFKAGLRYQYQYDGNKKNTAFYVPFELHYSNMKPIFLYDVADTTFTNTGWSYPTQTEIPVTLNALDFNFGHGFQFMVQEKKSINLEFTFFKSFILSQQFTKPENAPRVPNAVISNAGFKAALLFHF